MVLGNYFAAFVDGILHLDVEESEENVYLPDNLQVCASNNLLEHLAVIITPWIDIIAGRLTKGDCAFSMTNSKTSEGWLR